MKACNIDRSRAGHHRLRFSYDVRIGFDVWLVGRLFGAVFSVGRRLGLLFIVLFFIHFPHNNWPRSAICFFFLKIQRYSIHHGLIF